MKVYRVVNDAFDMYDPGCLWNNELFEALYYQLGYTSFHISGKKKEEEIGSNTEFKSVKEDGKYFFIFPEDAYKNALDISAYQSDLNYNVINTKILEYDIPFEILTQIIGYGAYNLGFSVEAFVEKKNFGKNFTSSYKIDYQSKVLLAKEALIKTKEFLSTYKNIDDKLLKKHLQIVPDIFYHHETSLIKDDFITGRLWNVYMPVNYGYSSLQVFDEQTNRLVKEGLFTNLNEHVEISTDIIDDIKNNDLEKARSRIREIKK